MKEMESQTKPSLKLQAYQYLKTNLSTHNVPYGSKLYVRIIPPFSSKMCNDGIFVLSLDSVIMISRKPVASSDSTL